jgi:hypothetical protein
VITHAAMAAAATASSSGTVAIINTVVETFARRGPVILEALTAK